MGGSFALKRADELMDEEFTAKWRDRQALGALPRAALGVILAELVASGEPVPVETIVRRLSAHRPADVEQAVEALDDKDMVVVHDGRVVLAYPFAAAPTAFGVLFPDGRTRFAVCAIDALGVSAMLGHPVTIRSVCHHCQGPLELHMRPDGPVGGRDLMVWVGERGALRKRAFSAL